MILGGLKTHHLNEDFMKIYNEDSNIGYFIGADAQYPEKLHELQNDLPFLSERMKIEKVKETCCKFT